MYTGGCKSLPPASVGLPSAKSLQGAKARSLTRAQINSIHVQTPKVARLLPPCNTSRSLSLKTWTRVGGPSRHIW